MLTGTVHGTFEDAELNPLAGVVAFTPETDGPILDPAGDVVLVPVPQEFVLDDAGHFTATLLATDDPDLNPTNFTYRFAAYVGGIRTTWSIAVPAGTTADLADILPTAAATGDYDAVTGPPGPAGAQGDPGGLLGDWDTGIAPTLPGGMTGASKQLDLNTLDKAGTDRTTRLDTLRVRDTLTVTSPAGVHRGTITAITTAAGPTRGYYIGGGWVPAAPPVGALVRVAAAAAGLGVHTYAWSATGAVAVVAGAHRLYNDTGGILVVTAVRASVGTAPTGASLLVDVNKGGTTIFTTQANRPTITAGTFTDTANGIDDTGWGAGQYLTVDVDQVGSTVPGSDLTVTIIAEGPA